MLFIVHDYISHHIINSEKKWLFPRNVKKKPFDYMNLFLCNIRLKPPIYPAPVVSSFFLSHAIKVSRVYFILYEWLILRFVIEFESIVKSYRNAIGFHLIYPELWHNICCLFE